MKRINAIAQSRSYPGEVGLTLLIVVTAAAMVIAFSTVGRAQLMTESCVDCHVVHAWQDEDELEGLFGSKGKRWRKLYASKGKSSRRLYASGLEETCEGCHADANSHTLSKAGLNTVPIVKNGQEPEIPLAGGNFYYVSGQSHLEKAGGSCSSCHRNVRHHSTGGGYRFLGPDIEGIGDPQYEYGDGHNTYKSGDHYCVTCHPNFCGTENQSANGKWIRHPTNTTIPMRGEYAGYVYRKDVPVSYPDPNKPERSAARIMCLSCHRPHGTPHRYLLRWNYDSMLVDGGENDDGCFACHSQKDEGYQGVQ